MSAKVIIIGSREINAGKTHFAAGLTSWLKRSGYHVAPLHLSTAKGDPVICPEGGSVSRATALLAEASGLMPDPIYEAGWHVLPELNLRHDVVVVEAAAGAPIQDGRKAYLVSLNSSAIQVEGLSALALFDQDLMRQPGPEVAALPLWTLATAPRSGVLTLPHLCNFADYQLVRGAEWITTPAVGRFLNLFLPATTNPESDSEWLEKSGLAAWISSQCATGTSLTVSGWDYPGARRVEPGDLRDTDILSLILGRRVPPPLPDEAGHERLADWFGGWNALRAFTRSFL